MRPTMLANRSCELKPIRNEFLFDIWVKYLSDSDDINTIMLGVLFG